MINDLMEIGRSESGCFLCCRFQPEKTVRSVLIEELETLTAGTISADTDDASGLNLEAHGVFLSIDAQTERTEMLQDETKFRQILGNLIKNALRYRKNRMNIHVGIEQDRLLIDVSDDGPGVKPEDHELIFRRYAQANQESDGKNDCND